MSKRKPLDIWAGSIVFTNSEKIAAQLRKTDPTLRIKIFKPTPYDFTNADIADIKRDELGLIIFMQEEPPVHHLKP